LADNAKELAGRVAIVTGSSRNIGRATALALSKGGAAVVVNSRRSEADAKAVAAEIQAAGGQATVHMADVSDEGAVAGLIEAAVKTFGRLDILVNNVAERRDGPITETSLADFRAVIASALESTFLCSRAAVPHLIKSGQGAIINLGGVSAHAAVDNRCAVVASKAGVNGLTRALASELAPHAITVNCVSPGYIATRRDAPIPKHFRERPVPLGHPGTPDDIAAMVRHLAGPGGRYVTGQVIQVNGGWYM